METYVTTVYVIADEIIRILKIQDDPQSKMSTSEVITFAIVTAKFFAGNYKMARYMCQKMRLFPKLLSNSRLNRRIHKISWSCWRPYFVFWLFLQEMIQAPLTLLWIAFQFPIVRKIELIKESVF